MKPESSQPTSVPPVIRRFSTPALLSSAQPLKPIPAKYVGFEKVTFTASPVPAAMYLVAGGSVEASVSQAFDADEPQAGDVAAQE